MIDRSLPSRILALGVFSLVMGAMVPVVALAETAPAHDHAHDHGHDHDHDHSHDHSADAEAAKKIYAGYFEDAQVAPRELEDWAGDWQSVYPLLQSGALDPVLAAKAKAGGKSVDDYRAYYETGYVTDVSRIEILGEEITFHNAEGSITGRYQSDGLEVLTYEKGNRGVRYIFKKAGGDAAAPMFVQFSDHGIAPQKAGHYHLYWGDDRATLLKEVTHWPTYYPKALSEADILAEMLAH